MQVNTHLLHPLQLPLETRCYFCFRCRPGSIPFLAEEIATPACRAVHCQGHSPRGSRLASGAQDRGTRHSSSSSSSLCPCRHLFRGRVWGSVLSCWSPPRPTATIATATITAAADTPLIDVGVDEVHPPLPTERKQETWPRMADHAWEKNPSSFTSQGERCLKGIAPPRTPPPRSLPIAMYQHQCFDPNRYANQATQHGMESIGADKCFLSDEAAHIARVMCMVNA